MLSHVAAYILLPMKRFKCAIFQAVVIALIGTAVAFVFNAFSANGISPFRKIADVPVVDDEPAGGEAGAAPEAIRVIDLDRFREIVDSHGVVIDARTAADYGEGHVPGAILLDYYEFRRNFDSVAPYLDFENEITIYCSGPVCEDSELLARELFARGYTKIMVFKGGFEAWEEAGMPVERE